MFDQDKVAAIIVCYFPDVESVRRMLCSLATQVDLLILMDNGGAQNFSSGSMDGKVDFRYVDLKCNRGLGFALNYGFEEALKFGCKYVATFDQDSSPPAHFIKKLKQEHQKLALNGVPCAAIGPRFFDRRELVRVYFPVYLEKDKKIVSIVHEVGFSDAIEVDILITSGMLVNVNAWVYGAKYDEGFFVDYTDTDWCFHVRAKGFKLYSLPSVEMGHELSESTPVRLFGLNIFRYSSLRRYYFFRNTVNFCGRDYVSSAWRRRLMSGLFVRFFINFFIDRKPARSVYMMMLGIKHGLTKQSGPFLPPSLRSTSSQVKD